MTFVICFSFLLATVAVSIGKVLISIKNKTTTKKCEISISGPGQRWNNQPEHWHCAISTVL